MATARACLLCPSVVVGLGLELDFQGPTAGPQEEGLLRYHACQYVVCAGEIRQAQAQLCRLTAVSAAWVNASVLIWHPPSCRHCMLAVSQQDAQAGRRCAKGASLCAAKLGDAVLTLPLCFRACWYSLGSVLATLARGFGRPKNFRSLAQASKLPVTVFNTPMTFAGGSDLQQGSVVSGTAPADSLLKANVPSIGGSDLLLSFPETECRAAAPCYRK
jgi:hypothetical protein